MPLAHRRGSASISNAVDEIRGLTPKDSRQSSLAARREYPKTGSPGYPRQRAETATEQYSQTGSLGKAEAEDHQKKIDCSQLDPEVESENRLNPLRQG